MFSNTGLQGSAGKHNRFFHIWHNTIDGIQNRTLVIHLTVPRIFTLEFRQWTHKLVQMSCLACLAGVDLWPVLMNQYCLPGWHKDSSVLCLLWTYHHHILSCSTNIALYIPNPFFHAFEYNVCRFILRSTAARVTSSSNQQP